ncbi:MAG TPA: pentapeptide repeat-containing protein [Mycobacteriales bacterium]|jgi:uncharacterized protein YjbI with pentapeptide repeats|nr:pentapeptide repeat-containing protein [Mycobacteriales bacterium]
MKPAGWTARLPGADAAVGEFPPWDPEDQLELRDLRVVDTSAVSGEVAERPELVNVVLDRCDIAGFSGRDGRADRVVVTGSRLRGVTWVNGVVQDVLLDGVTGEEVSLRFSTLRRLTLRDCVLPGLDFTEVTFDDVRLERCALQGAQFNGAKVKSLRIEGCDLSGATGVAALTGASVHPDDLLALAPSLAEAVGMRVRAEEE